MPRRNSNAVKKGPWAVRSKRALKKQQRKDERAAAREFERELYRL